MMTDDMTLLREYAQRNSEEAFAALVSRHVNLVYSVGVASGARPASGGGNHAGGLHYSGAEGEIARRQDHSRRLALPHGAIR